MIQITPDKTPSLARSPALLSKKKNLRNKKIPCDRHVLSFHTQHTFTSKQKPSHFTTLFPVLPDDISAAPPPPIPFSHFSFLCHLAIILCRLIAHNLSDRPGRHDYYRTLIYISIIAIRIASFRIARIDPAGNSSQEFRTHHRRRPGSDPLHCCATLRKCFIYKLRRRNVMIKRVVDDDIVRLLES